MISSVTFDDIIKFSNRAHTQMHTQNHSQPQISNATFKMGWYSANFGASKVAPNGERRKLTNEQAGESQE
jgi:hypothetical protein